MYPCKTACSPPSLCSIVPSNCRQPFLSHAGPLVYRRSAATASKRRGPVPRNATPSCARWAALCAAAAGNAISAAAVPATPAASAPAPAPASAAQQVAQQHTRHTPLQHQRTQRIGAHQAQIQSATSTMKSTSNTFAPAPASALEVICSTACTATPVATSERGRSVLSAGRPALVRTP
eukprot:CAMPEP_0173362458 /NCGR_PEP_ID=MMETSP1144-20121109/21811_1 /TAXON_ID=483371 /ORGANISM="non described non described, Strain CCMP2298" /LENGTH=177 /DNA_ID=CAMNT_0014312239 /DNA_START=239 /DNA_END=769 /DNA_ORIENTATION=+